MASIPTDPDVLWQQETLGQLRLILPAVLLSILALRFAAGAFTGLIARIQAQGWVEGDDGYGPIEEDDSPKSTDEDEIYPVVVKVKKTRRGLVLALFWLAGASYFADGIAQVVYTLFTNIYAPSLPLYQNVVAYSAGGLAAYALCAIAMTMEERRKSKEASWGRIYPRVIAVLGTGMEIAVVVLLATVLKRDPRNKPSVFPLPAISLAMVSFRLLVLVLLVLSQTPLFYKSNFVPYAAPGASENTSLLNGAATTYGSDGMDASAKKRSPLRSSKPPSHRPPDPKSLSILTLFTRVYTLFPYLWPSKSLSLQILAMVCVGLMLLKRVVNVWVPILFGRIISDLSAGRPPYTNIVLYAVASFLQDSNSMLYRYLWLPIEQYSEREMNSLSFDTLLNLSLGYHTRRKTGELLRILGRTDAINNFFETLIFTFLPVLIDLPVAAVVLGVRYGALIVSIVGGVSVIFVATSISLAESRTKLYRKLRDESQFMHQIKTDTLFNFETVKIFTAENFESQRLRNAMRVYQRGYFKVYSAWNSLSLIQDSISSFGFLICSFVLAQRVVNGEIEVGDFVTFTVYLEQIYGPLNKVAGLYQTVMSNLVDTEQLMELLSEEKDVVDLPEAKELVVTDAGVGIEFDNVRFTYDKKKYIVGGEKGISFSVKPGQSAALVGPSGGGKSTIMRLLYRFYDVSEGSIRVNGVDIRELSQTSLRKAIGLVPQEAILFNETARYNIAYGGGPDTTEEAIVEAAKSAQIHERIMGFSDQYETRVGERGQRLSGGEKQRVAIARVILKNPPVLLLDEATSALDTTNERALQARLEELSEGRTTLAIAHRLSTIVDSDIIYCLNEGEIVESGSHSELLAKGGVYAELWRKQIEGQEGSLASGAATPAARGSKGTLTPASED